MDAVKKESGNAGIHAMALERFKRCEDHEKDNYEAMVEDLRFSNGEQWPQDIEAMRTADDRPCLRINKMPKFVDRVTGELRMNRPSIKIIPVDSNSDPETARVLGGIIRNIEVQSDADVAYDTGGEAAATCGMGAWRIDTEYVDDESFDQCIRINRIKNQFSVFFDPDAQRFDKSDAMFCFVTELIHKDEYRERFGKLPAASWDSGRDQDYPGWHGPDYFRVAEYWYKQPVKKTLYLYEDEDGSEVLGFEPPEGATVLKEREVESHKVMWCRMTGDGIEEGPTELVGKYIRIVPVYGKETNIENKTELRGVVRHAKDSQRLYNYFRSMDAETVALAPRQPYLVTAKMLGEHKRMWDLAQKRNFPYLVIEPDPKMPGAWPKRELPQQVSSAITQHILVADAELNDTTALPDATLGEKSNERSGKAVRNRAELGQVGQFTYLDNLRRAIRYTGRIIVDLIPHIYDTERVERILGEDGNESFVTINGPAANPETGETMPVFDVTTGKYDVVVSTGPNYQTLRQESRDGMIELYQMFPEAAPATADIYVSKSDWPGADEIAQRLRDLRQAASGPSPEMQAKELEMQLKTAEMEMKKAETDAKLSIEQVKLEQERVQLEIERVKLAQAHANAEKARKEADAPVRTGENKEKSAA